MATFGETGTSGSGNSTLINMVNGIHNPAPADGDGTLDSISAYMSISFGRHGQVYVKAALYTVSGTTYTLVGETNERHFGGLGESPGSGYLWKTFTFASPPSITDGTNYALMVWAGNGAVSPTVTLKYNTTGTYKLTIKSQTYNGFPGYTQTPAAFYPSIYGTYTPTASADPLLGALASMGVGK